mgnify:CR=1 FL=1
MRAAIYSPYLDTLGGGERYVISVAKVFQENGFDVDVESKDNKIIDKLAKRFGMDLSGINVVDSIKRGDGYDYCFWLSDGSIPTLYARKNILHFQRPFSSVDGKSLINRMKFFRINKVVVNSNFTKKWIDKEYPVESVVIYPPVDVHQFKPGKKENLILCVARFSQLEQAKRQDVLIKAFQRIYDSGFRNWKLVLAGGSEVGRTKFVDQLIKKAKGYPIKIIENPSFQKITGLYGSAKILWSASGFEVDENKMPQKVEHFGIMVVEGMSAGAVPIICNAGGHKEIIKSGENGYLWSTIEDLISNTKDIIDDSKLLKEISQRASKDALKYSYARFKGEILSLIK